MCYHVSSPSARALKNEHKDGFRIADESDRYGAYDFPDLPATIQMGQTELETLQWSLIPHWAKNIEHAMRLRTSGYNARSETMFEKPMFEDAAVCGRCLLWLDGFYEWQHVGKKKIQYYIHMPDGQPFAVGGLMSQWRNPATGEVFRTCAIVTTEANELMAEIHNTKKRMPLILPETEKGVWLNAGRSRAEVENICRPLTDGLLIAKPITPVEKEMQVRLF